MPVRAQMGHDLLLPLFAAAILGGIGSVPDWIYTSPEIYEREVERIFHGRTWNFVALEAEIPNPGDYKRSFVGPTPVVVSRNTDGTVHVFAKRCAQRGVEFCR